METQILVVMRLLLIKLIKMDKWGGSHTSLRNISKGLPSRYYSTNKGVKLIKKAVRELVKRGFLLAKPSTGEIHISLNSGKAREIDDFLIKTKRFLGV